MKRRTAFSTGFLVLAVCLLAGASAGAEASAATRAAASGQKLVLFSVATEEQFVNNEDDRARGKGNNPFGNYKDITAVTKESGNGPFAGDEALFVFNVYSSANLKQRVGTASFTCQYSFDKNAFCDAAYVLKGGSLIGAGEFNFNAKQFSLAITGGTGKYRAMTGDVSATPSANHAQRLAFTLG